MSQSDLKIKKLPALVELFKATLSNKWLLSCNPCKYSLEYLILSIVFKQYHFPEALRIGISVINVNVKRLTLTLINDYIVIL